MAKRSTSLPNMVINLNGSSPDPVYQQLYNELRGGILDGQLVPGTVLTDFITRGHFARHIRLMRTSYAERQEVLVKEIKSKLAGLLEVNPDEAGMHLVGWLPPGVSDVDAARSANEHGVEVGRLSNYYIEPQRRDALTLGYSAYEPKEIRKGVRRLAEALIGMGRPI